MASPENEVLPPERQPRSLDRARFYVDEDLLPVGNAMMWSRTDVVVCGADLIVDELPRGKWDINWIPIVASCGWIAITGNNKIHRNPEESRVAVDERLRAICPHDARSDLNMWGKLTLIVRNWGEIERFIERHPVGPWWLSVTNSGTRELPYAAMSTA